MLSIEKDGGNSKESELLVPDKQGITSLPCLESQQDCSVG